MIHLIGPEQATQLRGYFAEIGYSEGGVEAVLGGGEAPSVRRRNFPRLVARSGQPTPLHALVRLLCVGGKLEAAAGEALLPAGVLDILVRSGIVERAGHWLVPQAMLVPFENFWVATDTAMRISAVADSDVVLGINATTLLLRRFALERPSRATLDLGTGCGPIALVAAAHSDRVVATDLNPRAVRFAEFNAILNGIKNIEVALGDGLQPVRGQTFDHIVSNPPFYISPAQTRMFCHAGLELDGFCRDLVKQAPAHLNEGGVMQIVLEWAEVHGESFAERVAGWAAGSGCDLLVFKGYTRDPLTYAETRIREVSLANEEQDLRQFREFMEFFRTHRVVALHGGMLLLRKRSGRNWIRVEDSPWLSKHPHGRMIERLLAARDLLSESSDEKLLGMIPAFSPDARLDTRFLRSDSGEWRTAALMLSLQAPLTYFQHMTPDVARFVVSFDGRRTLGELIAALQAAVSAPAEVVRRECLTVARQLLEQGLVEFRGA